LATQEFVAFLDADDYWHPRKLEFQMAVMAAETDLGLLGTGFFDWPTDSLPDFDEITGPLPLLRVPLAKLLVYNHLGTSSIVVRRAVLSQVGPFDTALQGPEDYDMWLRIAEVCAVANLGLRLSGYRQALGGLSKQAARMEAGVWRILQKLDARSSWRGQWRLRRKAYSYHYYASAYLYEQAGQHGRGLWQLARSLAWYPYPYRREDVRMSIARVRMLAVMLARLLHLRPAPTPPQIPYGTERQHGAAVALD
jgi:hypothetical protein